jgi:O-antigen/teichoic acid export membrane protein
MLIVSLCSIIRGYFNGSGTMKATANSQSLEQIFKAVLTIVFVEATAISVGINTELFADAATIATTVATFLGFAYLILFYRKLRKEIHLERLQEKRDLNQERTLSIVKKILMVSLPISFAAILSVLNGFIDSVTVVGILKTYLPEEVAKVKYGILAGKVDTLRTFPLAFNVAFATALVPAVSGLFAAKNYNEARSKISFTILLTVLLSLPCSIGLAVFADPILHLLFPSQYAGALCLQIAAFSIITIALTQTINSALQRNWKNEGAFGCTFNWLNC